LRMAIVFAANAARGIDCCARDATATKASGSKRALRNGFM